MPISVPVKPVFGATLHTLEAIVPLLSVDAQATATLDPVTAVVGAVIAATGAGLLTVIVWVSVAVAP